jgi:rare lipoprotein A
MKTFLTLLLFALTLPSLSQTINGKASYYSVKSNGGTKTASGIPFSDYKLTAASNHYPLGSRIKITNLSNAKSVVVTITDRGPFATNGGKLVRPLRRHPTRIVDLSVAAAKKIFNLKNGIIQVKTTRIK